MKAIWKQVLALTGVQKVMLPAGAEVLCAREQFDDVCIWFKCDTDAPKELRQFYIVGTGHKVPEQCGRYLGTAIILQGALMWHVFEAGSNA